ncbi:MAG: hypothetical protein K2J47_01805 [Ruminococcus sp.]|nr:hypothetical protein [Ruminococcus sp.]
MNIEIKHSLRPCIVKEQKALFHCWENLPHIMVGIIEHEDGTIHECYPDEIRFVDNAFADIFFGKADCSNQ